MSWQASLGCCSLLLAWAAQASAGTGVTDTATAAADSAEADCADDGAITPDLLPDDAVDTSTGVLVAPLPGIDPDDLLAVQLDDMMYRVGFGAVEPQALLDELRAIDDEAHSVVRWPDQDPALEPTFDIPIVDDPRVDLWISYFQRAGKERFQIWLSRITRYAPLFWPVLEQAGLPRDTIFLSMIESGFSTRATSWAAAAGPWQFMPATGRNYGLEVGMWVDERRDFERATEAAARYLRALYDEFNDWHLAWAAYNTGEGRIRRCVARTGKRDFWQIARTSMLYRETKHYVPKLIAAARVAKAPEQFGIEPPEYLPPLEWETITVTTAVDLSAIAKACGRGTTLEDLQVLNPALYRGITPPGREWNLRVPAGRRGVCAYGLTHVPDQDRRTFRLHRVKKGETVEAIAERYHTRSDEILAFNKISKSQLNDFDALVVPLPAAAERLVPPGEDDHSWNRSPLFTPQAGARPLLVHRVRPGDSLWRIARRYGVSLAKLKGANGLWRSRGLRIGQTLRVPR